MVRALLSAVSVFLLIPVSIVVLGGFLPRLPVVGPFGAVLNTGWPWVLGTAGLAAAFAGVALAIGGRKVALLFAACLAAVVGTTVIGYWYMTFAAAHGATYDPIRALDGFPPIPEPSDHIVFATVDGVDLRADVWLPKDFTSAAAGSLPAVVFVHGGAFVGGAPGTRPLLLGALADAGIVGVDADYRLSPPPRWNQAPGDVLCALSWVATAPALQAVDKRRVVVVGESAGGSLALMAAYAAGTDAVVSSCPDAGPPVVPAGVAAIAPAADLAGIWQDGTIYDMSGELFPVAYVGGTPNQFPDRYDAASPFRLLRPDLPPTLLLTGETDRMVLLERVTSLADRIRGAGAACELLVAPFAGHGFDGEPNSFGAQLTETILRNFVLATARPSS
jgi:acetyl esterase/lipase